MEIDNQLNAKSIDIHSIILLPKLTTDIEDESVPDTTEEALRLGLTEVLELS